MFSDYGRMYFSVTAEPEWVEQWYDGISKRSAENSSKQ